MRDSITNQLFGNTVVTQIRATGRSSSMMFGETNLSFFAGKAIVFGTVFYNYEFMNKIIGM